MKRLFLLLASLGLVCTACNSDDEPEKKAPEKELPTSCEIGDLVTVRGVEGVVFYKSDTVTKVVSVTEGTDLQWSTEHLLLWAKDKDNGAYNMAKCTDLSKYPAFRWCAKQGQGWYLPALNELEHICSNIKIINKTLYANRYTEIEYDHLPYYWSSSEYDYATAHWFCMGDNRVGERPIDKKDKQRVRAVFAF